MDKLAEPMTLKQEIANILTATGYPKDWPCHNSCPCCNSHYIKYSFSKYSIAHWICSDCEFVFINPFPSDNICKAIYNAGYYNSVRRYIEIPKAINDIRNSSVSATDDVADDFIDYLRLNSNSNSRVLEVGGGIGTFLYRLKRKCPDFDVSLCEFNEESARFAQEYYGLDVIRLSLEEISNRQISFDVIVLISTLEHISNPRDVIKACSELLEPGGLLLINVPNWSYLNRRFSKASSYNVIPPYHVSFFNKDNLVSLIESVSDVRCTLAWFSGGRAFHFSDLLPWNGIDDVVIPVANVDAVKILPHRVGRLESFSNKIACFVDIALGPLLDRASEKVFLNIVAQKPVSLRVP